MKTRLVDEVVDKDDFEVVSVVKARLDLYQNSIYECTIEITS